MNATHDQFAAIWADAVKEYQRVSGVDLAIVKLPAPGDIDSLRRDIEDSQSQFEAYRNAHDSLWSSLNAIMGPVEALGGAVAAGTAVVFPASPAIMGAISTLIKGARGVTKSYDYLERLFDDMKAVLARLQVHARKDIPLELRAVFIEILSCILEILGVSTKYIADGRAKRFAKGVFRPEDDPASELKERLDKLVQKEIAMVGALTLDITMDVLTQTTVTGGISKEMDLKIDGIVVSLRNIFGQLGGNAPPTALLPLKIKAINFHVPLRMPFPRNGAFTGRDQELRAIDKCFTGSASGDAPTVCAVIGVGGMGKTHIALEYAYQQSDRFTAVFWVSASTEEGIRTSFVDIVQQIVETQARVSWPESPPDYETLGVRLGIPGLIDGKGTVSSDPTDISTIRSGLFRWLQLPGNCGWLLIFDNADDLESFRIEEYIPNHGGGAILVTSRRPVFPHCTERVDLDGLDSDNAIKLLLRLARPPVITKAVRKDATAVVEKLGFMPLAVSHAGCFIHESNISMGECLRYYEEAFMTVQSKIPRSAWNYRKDTAATAWELSFSEVQKQDEEAASMLLTCSYLNPNEIFENLWEGKSSDMEFRLRHKARISLLASYSLIKMTQYGAFSIHPVVHTWARERLNAEDRLNVIEKTLLLIGRVFERDELTSANSSWDGREERRIAAHLESFNQYSKSQISEFLRRQQQSRSILWTLGRFGTVFKSQGKYEEAMKWYERTLAGYDALDKDARERFQMITNIADILNQQRKYDEALELYEEARAGLEKILGAEHTETLVVINNMANALSLQGKYDEALELHMRDLAASEKVWGKDHLETLITVGNIAYILQNQGQYDKAMRWYERALAGIEENLGKNHPKTLYTVENIASAFKDQGDYHKAMQWYERALAGYRTVFGENHPATIKAKYRVASLFFKQGKYREAVQLYGQSVEGGKKILGKDHPAVLEAAEELQSAEQKILLPRASLEDTQEQKISRRQSATQPRTSPIVPRHKRFLAGFRKVLGKDRSAAPC
ncbi:hypothetical protein TWF696_006252 [Orbilia brochopaga]|uniref:Fungal STAND N-terminal Goodbye domain-containing protein n=1 Tax=Orbilia brochopaga TaxID=3140254 RepID=A0AAV9UVR5_9PEZI